MSDDDDAAEAAHLAEVLKRAAADPFIPRSRERGAERIARDAEARRRDAEADRQFMRDLWSDDPAQLAEHLARIDLGEREADERDAAEAVEPGPAGPN